MDQHHKMTPYRTFPQQNIMMQSMFSMESHDAKIMHNKYMDKLCIILAGIKTGTTSSSEILNGYSKKDFYLMVMVFRLV